MLKRQGEVQRRQREEEQVHSSRLGASSTNDTPHHCVYVCALSSFLHLPCTMQVRGKRSREKRKLSCANRRWSEGRDSQTHRNNLFYVWLLRVSRTSSTIPLPRVLVVCLFSFLTSEVLFFLSVKSTKQNSAHVCDPAGAFVFVAVHFSFFLLLWSFFGFLLPLLLRIPFYF